MFENFGERVPPEADFCCYWFEKARQQIENGKCRRAGLLATQGIRGGANREVLKRIKGTGDIFFAESSRDWILAGANVHVSMIGFDNGADKSRVLDGKTVKDISPQLTAESKIHTSTIIKANTEIGGSWFYSTQTAWLTITDFPDKPKAQIIFPRAIF
jgi:type II restriction/modification system DNA methylase subunit YeeA